MLAQSRSRERVSASEFPVSPSICHPQASGDGRVSEFLDAIRAESCQPHDQTYALRSPSITQLDTVGTLLTSDSTMNFALEPICHPKKTESTHVDDIDKVMFVADTLVGVEDIKSLCRSGSTMSLTEDYADQEASRRVGASDFEVIRPIQRAQRPTWKGELVIGRKADTGRFYAIKVFRKASLGAEEGAYTYARREQAALRLVTERAAPCAMQLYWSFQDDKALYMIMNYVASDLRTFVECHGVLALSDATVLASQLVQGLMALHAIGIVHCNINPGGLFVEQGYLVIADFGHAYFSVEGSAQTNRHEAKERKQEVEPYQAPELLLEWSPHVASDWWSFGLVLCYMLAAQHPFLEPHELEDSHPAVLASKLLHSELPRWIIPGDGGPAADILCQCLQRNPALRLSSEGVKAHEFFSDIDWASTMTSHPPAPPTFLGATNSSRSLAYTPDPRRKSMGAQAIRRNTLLSSSQGLGELADFSFTWELGSGGCHGSGTISMIQSSRSDLQDNRADLNSRVTPARLGDCGSSQEVDYGVTIPSEFGVCRHAAPSPSKYGTIRKFSSINFDLDTLETVPASGRINPLGASPPSQPRRSTSTFTSPFTSTPGTARNKLRKKPRPENAPGSAPLPPPPVLDLPPGIEQIGHGIGYTRRTDPVYSRLSFPTLAPRSCQGIFSSECFSGLSPRKRAGNAGGERYDSTRPEGMGTNSDDRSEDVMDAVMREVYGPRWNADASVSDVSHAAGGADPRAYVALVKATAKVQSVGLGIGDPVPGSTNAQLPTVPTELSTLSPASTLRLVSSSVRDLRYV